MVSNLIKTRQNTFKQFGGDRLYVWTTIRNGGQDGSGPRLQCMLISILDFLKRTNPATPDITGATTIAQFRAMNNITDAEWPANADFNNAGPYRNQQLQVLNRLAQLYNLNLRLRIRNTDPTNGQQYLGELHNIDPIIIDRHGGRLVVIVQTPDHYELLDTSTGEGRIAALADEATVNQQLVDAQKPEIIEAAAEARVVADKLAAEDAAEREERKKKIALKKQIETALEQLSELKSLKGMVSQFKELDKKKKSTGVTPKEQDELNFLWKHIKTEYNNKPSEISLSEYILNKIEDTERTIKKLTENEEDVEAKNTSIGGSMYKKKYLKYKAKYLVLRKSLNI